MHQPNNESWSIKCLINSIFPGYSLNCIQCEGSRNGTHTCENEEDASNSITCPEGSVLHNQNKSTTSALPDVFFNPKVSSLWHSWTIVVPICTERSGNSIIKVNKQLTMENIAVEGSVLCGKLSCDDGQDEEGGLVIRECISRDFRPECSTSMVRLPQFHNTDDTQLRDKII